MAPVIRSLMKTFHILGSLSLLNLIHCASFNSKIAYEKTDPSNSVLEFAHNLKIPFPNIDSLNRNTSVSSTYFKRFLADIPELITDDVDDCEPELRAMIPLAKFTETDHLYQALKHEFIHGNTFNVLLPNLMKYFDRVGTIESNRSVILALMQRNKFDILFQNDAILFKKYVKVILDVKYSSGFPRLKGLIEYIILKPQYFDYIENAKYSGNIDDVESFVNKWNKLVLITNAPETFFFNFPRISFDDLDEEPSIWDSIVIPKDFYSNIFERLNAVINSSVYFSKYDNILNRIRFGLDEPELFEKEIQNTNCFSEFQQFKFMKCASLANKMELFSKLIRNISSEELAHRFRYFSPSRDDPIELHKVYIDIRSSKIPDIIEEIWFIKKISKHYKLSSIQCDNSSFQIELTTKTAPNKHYPVPQIINVNPIPLLYWDFIYNMLIDFDFGNVVVLERFLPDFFDVLKSNTKSEILISAANLKIIAQSESTCQLLRKSLAELPSDRPIFLTFLEILPYVLDEPVPPLADIVRVANIEYTNDLHYLKNNEQFKRLETMTGQSVSSFMRPKNIKNYFEYRHVFKYLIQTGQGIPQGIDESILNLLRIDFPNFHISKQLNNSNYNKIY